VLIVALALVVVLVIVTIALTGLLRSQQRAHARREDLLINQLLHAAGRAWLPPPAAESAAGSEPEPRGWTAAPEQLPFE
jgi:type II secretory pathway pseudopilin PulG